MSEEWSELDKVCDKAAVSPGIITHCEKENRTLNHYLRAEETGRSFLY